MVGIAKHPLLSYQPLRLIFQLTYVATIIPRIPYYALISFIPFLRPNSKWTAKQTFMSHLFHPILDMISRVGITETLTLNPGKEGDRFQTVKPASPETYKGLLAPTSTLKPETIGGTWFPYVPESFAEKTILLYFHGGAFIQGDGRDANCRPLATRLLKTGSIDALFSAQYRLSGYGGANPFPAALQDAVSAYAHLLRDLGVSASQIVVGGDSAGGNLATALLRYLQDFGHETALPAPKCALLFSPWVAPFDYDISENPHRHTDFVPGTYPRWGAHAYAGAWPGAERDPYVTPLGSPFAVPDVPVFVSAGSAELLYEKIVRFAEEMGGVEGNEVELFREAEAVHDTIAVGEILGFEDSAWEVAVRAGEFVGRC